MKSNDSDYYYYILSSAVVDCIGQQYTRITEYTYAYTALQSSSITSIYDAKQFAVRV